MNSEPCKLQIFHRYAYSFSHPYSFLEDLYLISHQRFKLKDESFTEKCTAMASGVFFRPLKQFHKGDPGFPVACSHGMMYLCFPELCNIG